MIPKKKLVNAHKWTFVLILHCYGDVILGILCICLLWNLPRTSIQKRSARNETP